ncbi:aminoglycoside phosphotransferase family protein [Streptomyces sp. WAC05374]|uniref:phosphotransferase n=1 Tax=Streptomyces sp. WAC05374 TaxID=2487420 RepID=UPI000F87B454|nr:phosphotransferase [Streptomyces sp. WAC05374]RST10945.1 aminoglycoside phosphotransferase family protein [Streptomyces sp. WAC05374]TDF42606.1 aminoglycoside phosphotransferase family protein [Streptomyces sp. WAC05374]TDF51166.1 aminoglycoside phosphotransferase family protein [Streptomyces sp. WAC05374]TDF52479.1 aminoglycoside phosphotransferase family protein [Streptomyces sp. WAC05374]
MLLENKLVDRRSLLRLVEENFQEYIPSGRELPEPEFFPLGEDSWSYRCGPLWISVRRDLDGHFPGAYEVALLLRESGKEYVLAPLPGRDGRVVHRIADLPVVVFPYVERATASAVPPTRAQLELLMRQLRDVHAFEPPAGRHVDVPTEDFRFPFENDLDKALEAALHGGAAECGPYGGRLADLVARRWDHLTALRDEAARVAARCTARWRGERPALTHGDPSTANVLFGHGVDIIDWGGAMWAPPERDWAALTRVFGAAPEGRSVFLRFYELRWTLAEIAEYAGRFTGPHTGDADDDAMWGRLARYLPAA